MRVVVTGGTGLIGHELVMSLGQDGHDVVVISRNPRQAGPMPETINFAKWDAKTGASWVEQVDGADVVVNLAGESIAGTGFIPDRWTPERKKRILQSRLDAGNAVVEAIEMATKKPKVLIQASAVGYYGTHSMEVEVTEAHPAGDDFLADVCKQWEASTAKVEEMGVRRAIIRTGIVLSKKGGTLPLVALPFNFFAGGPLGSGKQPFPWIHMADEVGAIRFLIENESTSGAYNLSAPNVLTNGDFARTLGEVLGRPAFMPAPGFAFKAAFGELSILVLEGQKAVPSRLQEAGYEFAFPTAKDALTNIYKPESTLATAS